MGHETVCDVLLSHGADLFQLDNLGRTALHHVTQAGQVLNSLLTSAYLRTFYLHAHVTNMYYLHTVQFYSSGGGLVCSIISALLYSKSFESIVQCIT